MQWTVHGRRTIYDSPWIRARLTRQGCHYMYPNAH
jgi:hypothetical protein